MVSLIVCDYPVIFGEIINLRVPRRVVVHPAMNKN